MVVAAAQAFVRPQRPTLLGFDVASAFERLRLRGVGFLGAPHRIARYVKAL